MGDGDIPGGDQYNAQHARRKLTVSEAADYLGVTVDAIRSRIKRETIEHVREEGRVYVILGGDQGEPSNDQGGAQYGATVGDDTQPVEDYHRDELVEELRDRVRALEEANRENRRIIAALTQRIPEIEPPQDPTPEPRDAPETTKEGEPSTESPASDTGESRRSSWWRRFFGFE